MLGNNDLTGSSTVLNIAAAFNGLISGNNIHGGVTGVQYNAAAKLSGNKIHDNTTGVVSTVSGTTNGLGFYGGVLTPNEIYSNVTGVNLSGRMQNQFIHNNTTGVVGSGILGGTDISAANVIESNTTGVSFAGTIQFNRIDRNATGIQATGGQQILHNLIYRNTNYGVLASGVSDVRIVSNTFYAPTGDNIRVQSSSSNIEVRDNILWAEAGYDIYVANNSQTGFFSDYNDLHASNTGKIFYWTKDFTDILDLQADVAFLDLHSIGTTVVNPAWSEPRFYNKTLDDYRVFDLTAGQRFSSPTVDLADPLTDMGMPLTRVNLLGNPSFEVSTAGWTVNAPDGAVRSSNPLPFDGTTYFNPGNIGQGFAEQTISLASSLTNTQIDTEDYVVVFGGRVRTLSEAVNDHGQITLTFLDAGGNPLAGAPVGLAVANSLTDRWELIGGRRVIPAGARSVKFRYQADRMTGTSNDAYLDGAFLYVLPETSAPDAGALGNTTADDASNLLPHIALRSPDLYADWELLTPHTIRWDTINNSGESSVVIDLYKDGPDGPQFLLNINPGTPDDGDFIWKPIDSGLTYGTYGLRIRVRLAGDASVMDQSTETFTVPEDGVTYWVDDASNVNDEYTPAAVGSNRNTGKLATAPKPNPVNVLRTYELLSGSVMNVDTGQYPLIYTAIATSKTGVGLGTDRGFIFRGPTNTSKVAELSPAIPDNTTEDLIYLDDADFMEIRNLTLTGGQSGLHLTGGSTDFVGANLTVHDSASHGILIENSSAFTSLTNITTYNHAASANGLYISGGAGGNITNFTAYNNNYGLYSTAATTINISTASSTGNRADGIYIGGSTGNLSNLILRGNAGHGLELSGNFTINTVEAFANGGSGVAMTDGSVTNAHLYNNGGWGISMNNASITTAQVHDNASGGIAMRDGTVTSVVVHDNQGVGLNGNYNGTETVQNSEFYANFAGIVMNNGSVQSSKIYGNSGIGIQASRYPLTLTGNTLYSNQYGIYGNLAGNAGTFTIANNLIYGDSVMNGDPISSGIRLTSGASMNYEIVNNTIYEPAADGLRVSAVANVHLRNNIIWSRAGYDIFISDDSQTGFTSNFNLLYATDGAKVGYWQGVRSALTDWQFANFRDGDSLSVDPLFVDPDGADSVLGASLQRGLKFEGFPNQTLTGAATVNAVDSVVQFAPAYGSFRGLPDDNQSFRWTGKIFLTLAGSYTFFANADGPQRLKINGTTVIDGFTTPSNSEQSGVYVYAGPGNEWVDISLRSQGHRRLYRRQTRLDHARQLRLPRLHPLVSPAIQRDHQHRRR